MEEKYNIKTLLLYIIIIIAVLLVFYGITILMTKSKKEETNLETNDNKEDAIIDNDTIFVSDIFNQKNDSYYVFASFASDKNVSTYQSSLSKYSNLDNSLKVYNVDLDSAFNKKYVSDTSDFDTKYPIFSETTILKITNGSIIEIYQGKNDIDTILKILVPEED